MTTLVEPSTCDPNNFLPVTGVVGNPFVIPEIAQLLLALGAKGVYLPISDEERLTSGTDLCDNFAMSIDMFTHAGLPVMIGWWNLCGLTGGESLAANLGYDGPGVQCRNALYSEGPQAIHFLQGTAVTRTPTRAMINLQAAAADAGAWGVMYDELAVIGPSRFGDKTVDWEEVELITSHAYRHNLKRIVCQPIVGDGTEDWPVLARWIDRRLCDDAGFDRYYGANAYTPEPSQYVGPSARRLVDMTLTTNGEVGSFASAQGFDLGNRPDLIVATVDAFKRAGIGKIMIWGGPSVNNKPYQAPAGRAPVGTNYYEIARAFGVEFKPPAAFYLAKAAEAASQRRLLARRENRALTALSYS